MVQRISRGFFAVLIAVALISVPVFAIYASNLSSIADDPPDTRELAPAAPVPQSEQQPLTNEHHAESHEQGGGCRGLQMSYWRLSTNPGKGEGKEEALDKVVAKADERGCTLAEGPPDGFRGKGEGQRGPKWAEEGDGPPWGPPAWARAGGDSEDRGEGRKGPKWTREGKDVPRGLAWGYWLTHGGEDACERIAARFENKPNAEVPEDLRGRIESELGCSLP